MSDCTRSLMLTRDSLRCTHGAAERVRRGASGHAADGSNLRTTQHSGARLSDVTQPPRMPDDDLPRIGAPATRALASVGVTRLNQLVDHREEDLLALHGFGPRALRILEASLNTAGLKLRS